MQVFKCSVALIMVLTLVAAKSENEQRIEPRESNYIAPDGYKVFKSKDSFYSPFVSQVGQFETNSTATLSVTCMSDVQCEKSAFIVTIGSAKELLGYQCTTESGISSFPELETGSSLTLIAYSGSNTYGFFYCFINSKPNKQTTTKPSTTTSTTTKPTTTTATSTKVTSTTSKPVVTGSSSDCQCGTIGGPRIVGGENVTEGEIPWQVALGRQRTYWFSAFCGGTLLSSNYVLTAAHCIKPQNMTTYKVFMGSIDLMSSDGVVVDLAEVIPHEKYDSESNENDILLLRLASSVTFTSTVFPACLPRKFTSETFSGKEMLISGWGIIEYGGWYSPDLMLKATVVGLTNKECNSQYSFRPKGIPSSMLCAQAPGKDTCQGDSGGPMTYTESGVTYVTGVVSFGIGCALKSFAGVYTRVTSYLDWIDSKIGTPLCSK